MTNINDIMPNDKAKSILDALEPTPEEVLLPSKGIFYTEQNKIIKQNGGKILVKPLTLKEEAILINPRIVKTGQTLNAILRSVIKTPNVDVNYLLSSDRMYIFFYVRAQSYGANYTFPLTCLHCNEKFNYTIKLSDLNVRYADEKKDTEPYTIILPNSKVEIKLRYSRGIDEFDESVLKGEEYVPDPIKDLVKLTVSISGLEKIHFYKFYENLNLKDVYFLRSEMAARDFGIQTLIDIACPLCGETFKTVLPITPNFFLIQNF